MSWDKEAAKMKNSRDMATYGFKKIGGYIFEFVTK